MREIKFRAWLVEDEVMIQSDSLCFEQFAPLKDLLNGNSDIQKIMQFTGLKDKNGVEIYEGDILQADRFYSENEKWVGVVEHNNFGGLCLYYNKYRSSIDKSVQAPIQEPQTAIWVQQNCEVIGNIYENKELLEE